MFLGTPKIWWIITGVCFLVGLILIVTGAAGTSGMIVGVFLVFAAMIIFAGAPMRYGSRKVKAQATTPPPVVVPPTPLAPPVPRRPRARIEGRDASEV